MNVADSLGGLIEGSHSFSENGDMLDQAPTRKGTNDEYDAFRHTLLAATLTETYGAENAKTILDSHEGLDINLPNKQNMDRWNNDIGIKSYQEWKDAHNNGQTKESLEKWLYDKVKNGETINNPNDARETRVYDGPPIKPVTWLEDTRLQLKIFSQKVFDKTLDFFISPAYGNGNEVIETVKQQVTSAKSTSSPIILDLNNNGVETSGVKQGAYFDHANDGLFVRNNFYNQNYLQQFAA
jgi:hypothetical protein